MLKFIGFFLGAASLLSVCASAANKLAPASETALDRRIAQFEALARHARCRDSDRVCAMGKRAFFQSAEILAKTYPDCARAHDRKTCEGAKTKRLDAVKKAEDALIRATRVHGPVDYEDRYGEDYADLKKIADYAAATQHDIATTKCPKSEKICAAGELAFFEEIDQLYLRNIYACVAAAQKSRAPDATIFGCVSHHRDVDKIDDEATTRLVQITDRFGLPNEVEWGEKTSHDAWLLAQHADDDQKAQTKFLALVKRAAERGLTPMEDYAYLLDRHAKNTDAPQLYGTQGNCKAVGNSPVWVPVPIKDEAEVEKRRAAAGMESFKSYRAKMNRICAGTQ